MEVQITMPELGPGIETGDILEVLVQVGDDVKKDQGILEMETDKATVTLPSNESGKVKAIHVKTGDSVPIGGALMTLEVAAEAAPPAAPKPAPAPAAKTAPQPQAAPAPSAAAPAPSSPPRATASASPATVATPAPTKAPPPQVAAAAQPVAPAVADDDESVAAGPAVRRFAREVGVDLRNVRGSGESGRITREDVLEAVRQANQVVRSGTVALAPGRPSPDGSNDGWGPVRIEKLSKIRRTIATKMHESWTNVPRVTNVDDADITELEKIRQASKDDYASHGIKLTTLPFVVKSVAMALKSHPILNASIDMANGTSIFKDYVNIGIAVDSDRGLVVPSLRNADQLSIPEIARQIAAIAEKVRTGSYSVDDLRGSTFTISNLGAIGGTYSTPIINTPEVAILLVGRARKLPVVVNDEVAIRLMMPLSLAYDHRLVDGGAAARFLNDVMLYLAAPGRLLLAP